MSEIVESLWHKFYTTCYKVDYQNLRNYCLDNCFVYHPEEAITDNHTEEEQPISEEAQQDVDYYDNTDTDQVDELQPEPQPEPEPEPEPEPNQQMIDLANNPDFSIETIAQQANRINNEENNNKDEVYVSLH